MTTVARWRVGTRRLGERIGRGVRFVRMRARGWLTFRGHPPLTIRAGRHFTGDASRRLPIIVLVCRDLGAGDADRLAGEVEDIQRSAGSFRPLFVIDTAEFTPFRERGYVVERIMRADELAAANPDDEYEEYVQSRLISIVGGYRASSAVEVLGGDLGGLREQLS